MGLLSNNGTGVTIKILDAWSQAWHKENHAEAPFRGENPPADLKAFSRAVCQHFNIRGISDPMYIVNVAAVELGFGDGSGAFVSDRPPIQEAAVMRLAARLESAYQTCAKETSGTAEDIKRLFNIHVGHSAETSLHQTNLKMRP